MTHSVVEEMEAKGHIGEEAIVIYNCSSCESEIYYGEEYFLVEHGLYKGFYCRGCTSKTTAGEE